MIDEQSCAEIKWYKLSMP